MRHGWIRQIIHDFEYKAAVQFKFHLIMMFFWTINGVAAIAVFLLLPDLWLKIAVLYLLLVSLYANWDTDYDAMSAALAAMHGEELLARSKAADESPTQSTI